MVKGMLHQLLAVEGDLARGAKSRLQEAIKIFKKPDRFFGKVTELRHFSDEHKELDTTDVKDLDTTVSEVLGYAFIALEKAWDATLQKEATNQLAKADIEVGYLKIEGVPAGGLLALESRLQELKDVLLAAPTLPPGRKWVRDYQELRDIYVDTNPESRTKTEKQQVPVVLYEATDKHPAQVQLATKDVVIGKYTDTATSGMLTPLNKANMLDRLDEVLTAVKDARQRANKQEVVSVHAAKSILDYIAGEDLTKKSPTVMSAE